MQPGMSDRRTSPLRTDGFCPVGMQYLSIALAYFSAIGILLVLPMDMTLTRLRREAPTEKLYEAYTS